MSLPGCGVRARRDRRPADRPARQIALAVVAQGAADDGAGGRAQLLQLVDLLPNPLVILACLAHVVAMTERGAFLVIGRGVEPPQDLDVAGGDCRLAALIDMPPEGAQRA